MKHWITPLVLVVGIACASTPGKEDLVQVRVDTPKNIILMIGDGMGIAQIQMAMEANNRQLNLEQFRVAGFSKTHSASDFVTDSGAGGTALSTGEKTKNAFIGMDPSGKVLTNIVELAEARQLSTGVVSTSSVTHATPASFVAHDTSRYHYQAIARDYLDVDIDVVIGGGRNDFTDPVSGASLLPLFEKKGYQVMSGLDSVKQVKSGKLLGFTASGHNPYMIDGRGEMLPVASDKAVELLAQNTNGFFLMIESSQIDWCCHNNDSNCVLQEMIDFDNTIGRMLAFARQNKETLVIVTADHETGGLTLLDGDRATGNLTTGFSTNSHSGVMVPVFAYGPGAEQFGGIQDNTDIFWKMVELLGLKDRR